MSNDIDLSRIEREALRKKTKVPQIDKKILSSIQLLNVSDLEIKIYTALMSLGNATAPILSKIINIEQCKVRDILQKLKLRGWIIAPNGSYSAVNPTTVINNEVYELKQNFFKSIEVLKTEALTKLESLYVLNNSSQLRFDEYWQDS